MKNASAAVWAVWIILTILIAGGLVYYYQFTKIPQLNEEISTLQDRVNELQEKINQAKETTSEPEVAADKVTENFYSWYYDLVKNNSQAKFESTNPYKLKADFSDYLTDSLISSLEDLYNDSTTNYDPIVCSNDLPTSYTAGDPEVSNDQATVEVTDSNKSKFSVVLTIVNSEWKLNAINCD